MGQHWLLTKTATHEPMRTNTEWVLANVNVTGYFRVNYDAQNWERLLTQLSLDHKVSVSTEHQTSIFTILNVLHFKLQSNSICNIWLYVAISV